MIKKFLRAKIMRFRKTDGIEYLGNLSIMVGWLPMVTILILKIRRINISHVELLTLLFLASIVGMAISLFLVHCIETVNCMEKNQCDFLTAWRATCEPEE